MFRPYINITISVRSCGGTLRTLLHAPHSTRLKQFHGFTKKTRDWPERSSDAVRSTAAFAQLIGFCFIYTHRAWSACWLLQSEHTEIILNGREDLQELRLHSHIGLLSYFILADFPTILNHEPANIETNHCSKVLKMKLWYCVKMLNNTESNEKHTLGE